jgi:hypothetical protein
MGGGKGLFTARESLVNDIPAGYGKTVNLFYSVVFASPLHSMFGLHLLEAGAKTFALYSYAYIKSGVFGPLHYSS